MHAVHKAKISNIFIIIFILAPKCIYFYTDLKLLEIIPLHKKKGENGPEKKNNRKILYLIYETFNWHSKN